MEKEIIFTQDVLFAVMKDGDIVSNFRKPDGGGCNPEKILKLFEGLVKYAKECPEDELMAFSLAKVIFDPQISQNIIRRMEEVRTNREDNQ